MDHKELRDYLETTGMHLEELAEKTGVYSSSLERMVRGEFAIPKKLAKVLIATFKGSLQATVRWASLSKDELRLLTKTKWLRHTNAWVVYPNEEGATAIADLVGDRTVVKVEVRVSTRVFGAREEWKELRLAED